MKERAQNLMLCISIIIAGALIGMCVMFAARMIVDSINAQTTISFNLERSLIVAMENKKIAQPAQAALQAGAQPTLPGSTRVVGVTAGNNAVKGDAKAPVLVVEFSDFQCPFSKRFYQTVFPQIEKEYIATNKVKFAYRDYPLAFHPLAQGAAIACRCAGKQNKYWQMFEKLSGSDSLEKENVLKYAREIGVNMKSFGACLERADIKKEIEQDRKEGEKFGVQGTPGFFINGRFIKGALPFETFKEIIEQELQAAQGKKQK